MTLTAEEFQKKVLDEIGQASKSIDTLLKNYDNLDKTTKGLMEDFTKAKNQFADTKDIDGLQRKMQLLQAGLQNEARAAWGSPGQKIARDPQLRRALMVKLVHDLKIKEYFPDSHWVRKDLDEANTPGSTMIANNELETMIYDALLTYGAYKYLDVRAISAKTVELRLKTARAAAAFVDEAAQISADSTKAGSKATLTPKKAAVLISVSNELLEDDITGVVQEIVDDILQSMAQMIDWIAFSANGDADSTDGGMTGMFYGGTSVVAASGNVSVATLDYEDFVKAMVGVNAATLQRAARWFFHPTLLAKTMYIKDGNGRPIFNTAIEAPSLGSVGSILGFPVTTVGNAPSTDSTSSKIAAFGDPMAQAIRLRKDLRFDRSEQWAFDTDEVTFRAAQRMGSKTRLQASLAVLTTAAS